MTVKQFIDTVPVTAKFRTFGKTSRGKIEPRERVLFYLSGYVGAMEFVEVSYFNGTPAIKYQHGSDLQAKGIPFGYFSLGIE